MQEVADVQVAFKAMKQTKRSSDLADAAQTIHIAALQASGNLGLSTVGLAYMASPDMSAK